MSPRFLVATGIFLVGVACTVVGAGLAWEPLGWIVAGLWLIAAGMFAVPVEE